MSYIKQEHPDYYMDPQNVPASNLGDGNSGEYNQQTTQASQNAITAFLAKLWALVNDPASDDLIAWDPSGSSFHVYDQSRFAREILPRYFKHNNFASFIRQLNMYGFRKMSTIEHGSLQNERDDIEFAHPSFIRGQESLLESIKRRAPDNQQRSALQGGTYVDSKTGRPIELSTILDNVRSLQTKQTSLNDKLSYMQTENQALWGEIGSLRQKHSKQQQIVSKLMEFLVQFLTSNSASHPEQSVEQKPLNEGITTGLQHLHRAQGQHPSFNQQDLSASTLKRKQAALMHNDEPNKRTSAQQQQQQQQFTHPPGFGRQQSVTINELADNDAGGWLHANTLPLVDLVPSPPPTVAQATDDNYPQQQQQDDYRWPTSTNEPGQNARNPAFSAVGNGDNVNNPYVPDFILRTNDPSGTKLDGANLTGIKTLQANTDNQKTSPTSYSQDQQQHKIGQTPGPLSFSLDDITGDVDHIQSSLDDIREFMFDNLPDEPSIDDLFGADHGLLSPLLETASTSLLQDQKLAPGEQKFDQVEAAKSAQSVPNVTGQLLEHLITESARSDEQRHTIDQLEREKSELQDKIHLLEQKKAPKK